MDNNGCMTIERFIRKKDGDEKLMYDDWTIYDEKDKKEKKIKKTLQCLVMDFKHSSNNITNFW